MYENILVAIIVLACLVYAVRKIVRILRGKESDGCAFCSGGTPDAKGGGCKSCIGCAQRGTCPTADPEKPADSTDTDAREQ